MWGPAIIGFLKALPELVSALREFMGVLKHMQNAQTDRKIEGIQAEVNAVLAKVRHEDDRHKLLELARTLNDARGK